MPQYVRTNIVKGAENGDITLNHVIARNQDRPGVGKVSKTEVPEETVIIEVKVNDKGYQAMLDSGAAVSVIDVAALETPQLSKEIATDSQVLRSFDNAEIQAIGYANLKIIVEKSVVKHPLSVI